MEDKEDILSICSIDSLEQGMIMKSIFHTPLSLMRETLSKVMNDLKIRIVKYPADFYNEDNISCLLFDLYNFPIDRVIERFEKAGGRIERHSEMVKMPILKVLPHTPIPPPPPPSHLERKSCYIACTELSSESLANRYKDVNFL